MLRTKTHLEYVTSLYDRMISELKVPNQVHYLVILEHQISKQAVIF